MAFWAELMAIFYESYARARHRSLTIKREFVRSSMRGHPFNSLGCKVKRKDVRSDALAKRLWTRCQRLMPVRGLKPGTGSYKAGRFFGTAMRRLQKEVTCTLARIENFGHSRFPFWPHTESLGQRLRLRSRIEAVRRSVAAAENEALLHAIFAPYLPFFYSDLFDIGYEAVGELDPRLETACKWKEPYREGIIYYLRTGKVRGGSYGTYGKR